MRSTAMAALAMWVTGCGSGTAEEPDGIPPPPADATSSCVYERTPIIGTPSSTVWFNRSGQVIRVDGWFPAGDAGAVPAPYYLSYDDAGRLVEERTRTEDAHYIYTPEQIRRTSNLTGDDVFDLIDGRAVHYEGPEDVPLEDRWFTDYTYDGEGRLASEVGISFVAYPGSGTTKVPFESHNTYDAQGRVIASQGGQNGSMSSLLYSYTETADQLVVDIAVAQTSPLGNVPLARRTFDFDASHRLVRAAVDQDLDGVDDQVDTYVYRDGEIDEISTGPDGFTVRATGSCAPPAVTMAPALPLPIQWGANMASFSPESVFGN